MFYIIQYSLLLFHIFGFAQKDGYLVGSGETSFLSSAPMERISASTKSVKGVIEIQKLTFAVNIPMNSFVGFNSPLQQEHFNEHYIESKKYPNATFVGNLIGIENFTNFNSGVITAKGKLTIHGITKIISVPINVKKDNRNLQIDAHFKVEVKDYNIEIPPILETKIAPIINVDVNMKFVPDV